MASGAGGAAEKSLQKGVAMGEKKIENKEDLLKVLLQGDGTGQAQGGEAQALVVTARSRPPVVTNLKTLQPLLPGGVDEELADFFRFALLGLCVGFSDRYLSPHLKAHTAIVPALLEDIRGVFDQLKAMGADYDPEVFRFNAYDYGVHKAYYLDWQLYLSKDLY